MNSSLSTLARRLALSALPFWTRDIQEHQLALVNAANGLRDKSTNISPVCNICFYWLFALLPAKKKVLINAYYDQFVSVFLSFHLCTVTPL